MAILEPLYPILSHHQPSSTFPEYHRRRSQLIFKLFPLGVLLLGLIVVVVLSRHNQDVRNRAFTGFSVQNGAQTFSTNEPLHYALPSDIPQNPRLISSTTTRGLFYTFTDRYKNEQLEYQEVKVPTIVVTGKVFYIHDPSTNVSYVFSRFENVPALPGKLFRLWLLSAFESRYFFLTTSQYVVENKLPVVYAVYVGSGDLKAEGKSLVYSYDTPGSENRHQPDTIFVSVNF